MTAVKLEKFHWVENLDFQKCPHIFAPGFGYFVIGLVKAVDRKNKYTYTYQAYPARGRTLFDFFSESGHFIDMCCGFRHFLTFCLCPGHFFDIYFDPGTFFWHFILDPDIFLTFYLGVGHFVDISFWRRTFFWHLVSRSDIFQTSSGHFVLGAQTARHSRGHFEMSWGHFKMSWGHFKMS